MIGRFFVSMFAPLSAASEPPDEKLLMVCTTCRSEDVLADTQSRWTGRYWETVQAGDRGFCNNCGRECRITATFQTKET